jgi:hypothetical protein
MRVRSSCRLAAVLLLLLPALAACQVASDIDAAMRRVDVFDRLFGASPPPDPPVQTIAPPPEPVPFVEPGALPKDPLPPPIEEATLPEPPAPQAVPVDPAARRAALLRQNPWIAGFWGQLTPAQRAWATRRMQRGGATLSADGVAVAWDRMGLAERVRLLFGEGA